MPSIRSFDGGEFSAYLALPAGGRGPGIVVLQEIFGVNANMRSVCDWFAERGFIALCPDLFWRIEPGIELTPEHDHDRAMAMLGKLDFPKAIADAAAAMDFLRTHPSCTGRVGAVGYCLGGRLAYEMAVRQKPDCAVGYYGVGIEQALGTLNCPLMLHVAELDKYGSPEIIAKITAAHPDAVRVYPGSDHAFARRNGAHYNAAAAELANLRTIEFLLRHLMLKQHSLEAIWGEHIEHEFSTRSTEDTLATMVDDAYVNHIPILTGGVGKEQLREFYSKHFIPQMPPDTTLTPLSRTIGDDQIVDEMIFQFTHTIKMDWMLPGVEPTGKRVEVPLVAIVRLRGDKLAHEHIYWDQASVLVQLGLLDAGKLPVAGVESARKAVNPKLASRALGV
ncbi:MAG: dienelactone hydrolase family protein [Acidobacteriia bacterium]|nr:dienelactone hydrolase family protein [Terriglobia bacterium]